MTMFTFFTTVCRHKLSICFHTRVCFAKLRQIPDNMIFICIQNLRICIMQQKKHCPGSASCGAGGNRTLVQTGKPYAFYTLIPAFGFRVAARPGPPTATLSSKFSFRARGRMKLFPI